MEELQKTHAVGITFLSLFDCLPGTAVNWCSHSVLPLYIPPITKMNLINYLYFWNAPEWSQSWDTSKQINIWTSINFFGETHPYSVILILNFYPCCTLCPGVFARATLALFYCLLEPQVIQAGECLIHTHQRKRAPGRVWRRPASIPLQCLGLGHVCPRRYFGCGLILGRWWENRNLSYATLADLRNRELAHFIWYYKHAEQIRC